MDGGSGGPGGARALRRAHPRRLDVPALVLASALLLAVGLWLPLIRVEKLVFWKDSYSVATGVWGLWEDGSYVLAAVVFFFSVVFPIAKLGLLGWIWLAPMGRRKRERLLSLLAGLGKWSMLDVFVVAVLIVAVKIGPGAQVFALPGVYFFGCAIALSMVATQEVRRLAQSA